MNIVRREYDVSCILPAILTENAENIFEKMPSGIIAKLGAYFYTEAHKSGDIIADKTLLFCVLYWNHLQYLNTNIPQSGAHELRFQGRRSSCFLHTLHVSVLLSFNQGSKLAIHRHWGDAWQIGSLECWPNQIMALHSSHQWGVFTKPFQSHLFADARECSWSLLRSSMPASRPQNSLRTHQK